MSLEDSISDRLDNPAWIASRALVGLIKLGKWWVEKKKKEREEQARKKRRRIFYIILLLGIGYLFYAGIIGSIFSTLSDWISGIFSWVSLDWLSNAFHSVVDWIKWGFNKILELGSSIYHWVLGLFS